MLPSVGDIIVLEIQPESEYNYNASLYNGQMGEVLAVSHSGKTCVIDLPNSGGYCAFWVEDVRVVATS